ncbi:hypothetical protein EYF80_058788 [Liparis tanakae]|uniref:Uncharacterized protein n=1 Tax=Liparis tanakae TaxID=230148 RepID=A0A4Z2EQI2_9TELE|nr:hypothetical protein EYF80_058788 [Liparis tanakae]
MFPGTVGLHAGNKRTPSRRKRSVAPRLLRDELTGNGCQQNSKLKRELTVSREHSGGTRTGSWVRSVAPGRVERSTEG